jgi:hypothetical protein
MPSAHELIGIVVIVLAIWFVLKLVKAAIKLTLFVITVVLIFAAVYFLLLR